MEETHITNEESNFVLALTAVEENLPTEKRRSLELSMKSSKTGGCSLCGAEEHPKKKAESFSTEN
jgi:hypothetical protein